MAHPRRVDVLGKEAHHARREPEESDRHPRRPRRLPAHPDEGAEDLRRTLLDRLESLRDGGRRASLVLGAAGVAVVADEKIEEAEEAEEQVIREVGAALGLDPDLV